MAIADSFHYRNIIVGERASGMGGAYSAISDDPSGLYYNPAGIVYAVGSNISASANAYHITQKQYKDVLGGLGWNRKATIFLPNFLGVVQKVGKGRVGLSSVVPDSIIENQDQEFTQSILYPVKRMVVNYNNEDSTSLFGLSYARELFEGFSGGLTIYAHRRSKETILNQYSLYDKNYLNDNFGYSFTDDPYLLSNDYYETEEWGIKPVLGMMWAPASKVSLGMSVSDTFIFTSQTNTQKTLVSPLLDESTDAAMTEYANKRQYPLNVNAGVALFLSQRLIVSGDASYFTAVDADKEMASKDQSFTAKDAVLNFAVGSEFYLLKNLALRAGAFSNYSSAQEIKAGSQAQPEHIDLYGGSLSFSHFSRNSSITLGGTYSFGEGKAQVSGDPTEIQDSSISSLTIILSTAYSY